MTLVIIIVVVLAIAVMAAILTPVGRAIFTSPRRLRASRPYRRPESPGEGDGEGEA